VVAPEFTWDDYKGVDVKGKTLVMLVNDPPVPDPARPGELDPKTFGGSAMTYYGRWTYKYEIGKEKGAAGVLLIHETGPAGYPFDVVQNKVGEQFDLITPDKNMGRVAIEGWISLDQGKKLLQMAGQDFDALKKRAATREFTPVPLGETASMTLHNTLPADPSCTAHGRPRSRRSRRFSSPTTRPSISTSRIVSTAASTIRTFIRCSGRWMPGVSRNTTCASG